MISSQDHLDPAAVAALHRLATRVVAEERELALDLIATLHTVARLPHGYEPMIDRLQTFQAALRVAVADDTAEG